MITQTTTKEIDIRQKTQNLTHKDGATIVTGMLFRLARSALPAKDAITNQQGRVIHEKQTS